MRTIKQLLITVAMLLCSVVANAYDFEVNGIYYNIISTSDLTVEVTNGDNKYSGEVIIPETIAYKSKVLKVISIGDYAFRGCTGLTSVVIGNSVTSIGVRAFAECKSLTNVVIGNSVRSIGNCAFTDCTGLTSIEIGNSVTSIEEGAFCDCDGLTSIEIPNSVTSIGDNAFLRCYGLTNVVIGNSVTSIGDNAFLLCTKLTSAVIGNSVTSIGEGAFEDCSKLTSIEIPNSVTSIGDEAFEGCTSLKDLRIEDGETTLSLGYNSYKDCPLESLYLGRNLDYNTSSNCGYSPFYNKKTLKSVTIGNSVTRIGNYVFSACDSLTSIRLLGETPPTVGSNNFTNKQYLNTIVYVPKGTLATYQAADTWKDFWDIQEFDVTAIENVEDVTPAFEITSSGIQFTAADGKAIAIYAPNGALVEKIDNYAGEEIALDKGVYIVRVGDKTMKVKL